MKYGIVCGKGGGMRGGLCGGLRAAVVSSLSILALFAGACGGQGSPEEATSKLKVVATTTQIGDFVGQVGGDAVDAHQILQPNSDPHDYEPRPDDVKATAGARLVFVNGDDLDSWMNEVVTQSGGNPTVVDLSESIPEK